jgi:hypothetical protein
MGAPVTDWYGTRAAWWAPLERDARRRFGPALRHRIGPPRIWHRDDPRTLAYFVGGLEVIGEPAPVDVEIRFHAEPPYDTYGLLAQDYPHVFAKTGARSIHRLQDGSLCLFAPFDPPERRWTSDKGLLDLIELTRQHLFYEVCWRVDRKWPAEDAPHGLPQQRP